MNQEEMRQSAEKFINLLEDSYFQIMHGMSSVGLTFSTKKHAEEEIKRMKKIDRYRNGKIWIRSWCEIEEVSGMEDSAVELMDEMIHLISAQQEELNKFEWKPIATAPKDGKEVIVYEESSCGGHWINIRYYSEEGDKYGRHWRMDGDWSNPTHWMPLPEPPKSEVRDGK